MSGRISESFSFERFKLEIVVINTRVNAVNLVAHNHVPIDRPLISAGVVERNTALPLRPHVADPRPAHRRHGNRVLRRDALGLRGGPVPLQRVVYLHGDLQLGAEDLGYTGADIGGDTVGNGQTVAERVGEGVLEGNGNSQRRLLLCEIGSRSDARYEWLLVVDSSIFHSVSDVVDVSVQNQFFHLQSCF